VHDLPFLNASELSGRFRRRELSPVEVLEASLARAELVQGKLNPFRVIHAGIAREMAHASEARWRAGNPLSRLDGMPVVIKDNHAFAGQKKTSGSRSNEDLPPQAEDALHVARLRDAGAVIFARGNMPDLGWKGVSDGPLHGVTRNPWDPALTPGGSSGGSAVAIATGCAVLATGGDGGGSIRIPAAFTGTYGIKPTTGRVPGLYDSPAGDLVAPGPISRSVADAALALTLMCRPDPRDPMAAALTLPDFVAESSRGVEGLRVAVSASCGFVDIDAARLGALHEAARALEHAGAIVTETDPPAWNIRNAFVQVWEAAYASAIAALPGEKIALLDPGLIEAGTRGMLLSAATERQAQAERTRLMHAFIGFFQEHDLLLTPTMPIAPFAAGSGLNTPDATRYPAWYDWTPYTWVFNATKMPAASCPWGLDADSLPQGVQLVATHFREDLILRASAVLESNRPFAPPPDAAWRHWEA
jgi:aspartyl-tRNA(Asn)/glutamyl-tRNA(Gln) amidotransferase subunit A